MEVNYTKYDAESLLEALSGIDSKLYPENYAALTAEIASRRNDIDEYYQQEAERTKNRWNKTQSSLGVMQILTAISVLVMLVLSISNTHGIVIFATALIIVLNATAGLTLLKRKSQFYILSYLNQGLQVFSFGMGTFYYNYYGLGGVFLMVDWVNETFNWISASFNLGGSVFEFSNEYSLGFVQIDILAIFIIWLISKCDSKTAG
ncbi:hypothetical protein ACVFI8_20010 [Agarivorans sp. MS3-6]|uniref:hypothetical protein n=1 Tax=Agarivorans sp. TSD2052 TaxID=2937286 RepID=UPI00200FB422|nr:hypothetical protein [Agarivorans sp. TSD2052]UPW16880.1 hypothetical protein M0C34_11545 [Agarivorans sp. TSD2052]